MNKTWILLGVFLGLMAIAFFLLRGEDGETSSYDSYEGDFAIEDPERIGRIFFVNRSGVAIDLKRQKDHWTVNDRYRVRKSNAELMLQTLKRVEVMYIPPRAAIENIIEEMAVFGIKVELYDTRGKRLKAYYVGGVTPDERGTHFIMEGADQPFVVHIPTMDGSLRPRFEIPESHWRDRRFLDVDPEQIEKVSVNYPREKNNSFILERQGKEYSVKPMYAFTPSESGSLQDAKANKFLRAISDAACESYENQYPKKDSIRSMLPWASYLIHFQKGDSLALTLYPTGILNADDTSYPVHRFFVDCSTGDFMLAQSGVLKELLRGYDYFIQ